MATTLVSYGLRMAANYPASQIQPGETATIHTDTESQPLPSLFSDYVYHPPFNQTRDGNKTIKVLTKVFRTDLPADSGNTNFSACYISIQKKDLNGT